MTNEPGKQNGHRLEPEAAGAPVQSMGAEGHGFHGPFGLPRNSLNNRFVYAVISQRAHGLSIGINLNPDKRCNFDCAYCEVNRNLPARDSIVDLEVLADELDRLLTLTYERRLRQFPYFQHVPQELLALKGVALSGEGEPTLSPQFAEIVREVVHVRSAGQ